MKIRTVPRWEQVGGGAVGRALAKQSSLRLSERKPSLYDTNHHILYCNYEQIKQSV